MRVTAEVPVESVVKVLCDVCGNETNCSGGKHEYGTLSAHWGYASSRDGDRYMVDLCEGCFFSVIEYLKEKSVRSDLDSMDNLHQSSFGLIR